MPQSIRRSRDRRLSRNTPALSVTFDVGDTPCHRAAASTAVLKAGVSSGSLPFRSNASQVRRKPCLFGESRCRRVELVVGYMRVAAHGGQVGVAEVLSDEAGVARCLTEPRGGGVPQRVRGYAFLEPAPLRCAADNRGKDRRLQASATESAEDGIVARRPPLFPQPPQLSRERQRERLTARLAALAAPNQDRRPRTVERNVAPVERNEF